MKGVTFTWKNLITQDFIDCAGINNIKKGVSASYTGQHVLNNVKDMLYLWPSTIFAHVFYV